MSRIAGTLIAALVRPISAGADHIAVNIAGIVAASFWVALTAIATSTRLLVSNAAGGPVGSFVAGYDAQSGAFLGPVVDDHDNGGLIEPDGLAVGPDGNLRPLTETVVSSDSVSVKEFEMIWQSYSDEFDSPDFPAGSGSPPLVYESNCSGALSVVWVDDSHQLKIDGTVCPEDGEDGFLFVAAFVGAGSQSDSRLRATFPLQIPVETNAYGISLANGGDKPDLIGLVVLRAANGALQVVAYDETVVDADGDIIFLGVEELCPGPTAPCPAIDGFSSIELEIELEIPSTVLDGTQYQPAVSFRICTGPACDGGELFQALSIEGGSLDATETLGPVLLGLSFSGPPPPSEVYVEQWEFDIPSDLDDFEDGDFGKTKSYLDLPGCPATNEDEDEGVLMLEIPEPGAPMNECAFIAGNYGEVSARGIFLHPALPTCASYGVSIGVDDFARLSVQRRNSEAGSDVLSALVFVESEGGALPIVQAIAIPGDPDALEGATIELRLDLMRVGDELLPQGAFRLCEPDCMCEPDCTEVDFTMLEDVDPEQIDPDSVVCGIRNGDVLPPPDGGALELLEFHGGAMFAAPEPSVGTLASVVLLTLAWLSRGHLRNSSIARLPAGGGPKHLVRDG